MDLYMTSAEPGLTLQEMIDCDIKSGVEFESDPLLGGFEFPSGVGSGLDSEFEFKAFEPLFDPDELMEVGGSATSNGVDHSPIASWMNLSSMANFNLDVETSLMVNPSVVLPSPHHPTSKKPLPLPSPSTTSISSSTSESAVVDVISDSQNSPKRCLDSTSVHPSPVTTQVVLRTSGATHSPVVSSDISVTGFTAASNRPNNVSTLNSVSGVHSQYRHIVTTTSTSNGSHSPGITAGVTLQSANRTSSNMSYTPSRSKPLPRYRRERTPEEKSYPKPAYSYACLIALALKNSLTGSLPVSEIYNFMCEHFPYFRTAPNGWKNSVRHNLSLNKCFEKIEKPVVSGSNQRKGCLWALNPLKMHKMDEEVQKWSKKDLQGIKDAMTRPEVLESLERGEMKFEATSGASSCSEDSEEDEDVALDAITFADVVPSHNTSAVLHHPPIKVISSSTTLNLPQSLNSRVIQPNNTKLRISSPQQLQETQFFAGLKNANITRQFLQQSTNSPEPEYILPDSTLPEINIQSNGNLVDDLGNEITVEGDLGSILNPRGVTTSLSTGGVSGTNLILKKVNAAAASPLRSSFVYATSATAGLGPHQNGVSRLVLTNAKLS